MVTSPSVHISLASTHPAHVSLMAGFLENLENNKFIFLVLGMSLIFTKSRNVLEQILPVKKFSLLVKI